MTGFAKRPYRELLADTQEARDQYYAALREYYRIVEQTARVPVRATQVAIRVPLVTQAETPPAIPPPEPPSPSIPEPEPIAVIETIPENRSIPRTDKDFDLYPEWKFCAPGDLLDLLLLSQNRYQQALTDRAAFYCRQFVPDALPFSQLPLIAVSAFSYGEPWPGHNEYTNLSRRRNGCRRKR